jgi:UTP--glucose-1-phosphate uridylyltransferase
MTNITTAVLPVAGMGSRFLPVTKASPKEMLPIIDKPLIQYIVDEAVASGIKQIVLVTSYTKRAIEDYFDTNYELETRLFERGKHELLQSVQNMLPQDVSVVYVRQAAPKGLGDAVLCAEKVVGQQPFAVLLADDIIDAKQPCLAGMIEQYANTQGSVLAVETVPNELIHQYGVVQLDPVGQRVASIVEKPPAAMAPSNLGVIGRYILSPAIFTHLKAIPAGAGGEIQLTDAIARLLAHERVSVYAFSGKRYDCGSKAGFLQATLAYAAKQPGLRSVIDQFVQSYNEDVVSID